MIKKLRPILIVIISLLVFTLMANVLLANALPPKEEAIQNALNLAENKASAKEILNKETAEIESTSPLPDYSWEIPDWIKRTSYGVIIETDQKPRIYLESVQPLYQSEDKINTFFTHDRVSIQDERGTYSAGIGYRRLAFKESLLLGINNFFDFQDLHKHYRTGLGVEAIGKALELRANSYFALSKKRTVEESGGSKIFEKAVNGGDIELGGPVPYLPWLKLFGTYYRYDFRKFKDMQGWKLRGQISPFKFIVLNLETYDDNKGEAEYRMDGRLNLAFDDFTPRSILSAFKPEKTAYPEIDLKEHTLDRVERNFNIQTEKWVESANATIEIYRGN